MICLISVCVNASEAAYRASAPSFASITGRLNRLTFIKDAPLTRERGWSIVFFLVLVRFFCARRLRGDFEADTNKVSKVPTTVQTYKVSHTRI